MRTELLLQLSLEILLAVGLFYVGKLLIMKSRDLAGTFKASSPRQMGALFTSFGGLCQLAAVVWGGLGAVSVLMVV